MDTHSQQHSRVAPDKIGPDDPRFAYLVRRGYDMRMRDRSISRAIVTESIDTYEIIETYPEDRYFPTYLVFARHGSDVIHVVFAADVEGGNVRVVTAYRPAGTEWDNELKRRRS
jgi:hypothetical protein